ncbi:MAG TPA: microcin C ABC transporter permease YejB [Alphaproteobacteria bacterium]|nr:microcin C ABC transporter permease YejB [Alphaproteobacteria bacterium]
MLGYLVRRLLLIIPTLFGIMVVNFAIVQFAPGGPVETVLARLQGGAVSATARLSGSGGDIQSARANQSSNAEPAKYRGARGIDPTVIKQIEVQFGFDKPPLERFWLMMRKYAVFDFGTSYFRDRKVIDLIADKMPVSISLGLWSTLIIYLISIPLGIGKAVRDGSRFDAWSSGVIILGNAVPSFLFAILLVVVFAGGRFVQWFPLSHLTSDNFDQLSWWQKVVDYLWHIALPTVSIVIGGFASLTMLTKNSFLDEINKQYVITARAKGLTERRVLYGHVFRNAMLIVIAGFPGAFISILFTSALLVEIIFSLDGLGLLGYEAAINRDYPVMFGTLYMFTLLGLVMKIVSDLTYTMVDPRIDFETRG